jgi:hypothetical protein
MTKIKISSLTSDLEFKSDVFEGNRRTTYVLNLFKEGDFKLRFTSGTSNEDCKSNVSFGMFEESGSDLILTYTTFDFKNMPSECLKMTETLTRGPKDTLLWNNLLLVPTSHEVVPEGLIQLLNSDFNALNRLEKPVYWGILELVRNPVPTNFTGSYKYETRDDWDVVMEEFFFFPNGLFRSFLWSAGHDYSNERKILGTYTKTPLGFDLVYMTYVASWGIENFPKSISLKLTEEGLLSHNNHLCIKID